MSRSTLAALGAVLVLLLGAVVWVGRARRPVKPEGTALSTVRADQIVQMGLAVNGATTTLKIIDGEWRIVTPFEDRANAEAMDRLVSVMKDVQVGTVISENPARHAQFEVNDASATRLQVFVKGKDAPELDYWVGKEATDPASCFVRVPGSNEVRTAEGLPASLLLKSPELFRSPDVSPIHPDLITALTVKGALELTVANDKGAWVNDVTKRIVAEELRHGIAAAMTAWRAETYAVIVPTGQGFDKPFLTIEERAGERTATIVVGGPATAVGHTARFVRSSDRPAILVVDDKLTQAVIEALKKAQ